MKQIIIIILFVQPFLTFAGGTVWKTETIKQAIKDQENIFKAKVIDFKVTTPDGKNYTAKEYKAHMEINRYINQKIYSLTDFDWEEEEDPFGEPKVIDKRIQKIIKETESKRKELIKYYESKLKEFPKLSGNVEAKVKIIEVDHHFYPPCSHMVWLLCR